MDNYNGYNQNQDNEQKEQNQNNVQNNEQQTQYQHYQNPQSNQNNQGYGNGYNNGSYNNYNSNMNEYSYQPPKKKKNRKLITALVATLCVVAIGATAIIGGSILTGKTLRDWRNNTNGSSNNVSNNNTAATTTVNREDLPSLVQLATPDDAMKIPDIVKKVSPSVVGISCMTNEGNVTGTGIIMSEDGYIITNAHVVEDAKAISVVLPSNYTTDDDQATNKNIKLKNDDNNSIEAKLIGKDVQTDIAVLKIEKTGLTAVEFGKSGELQVGEVSIVIGNPLGLNLANSVTAGIISATDRTLTIEDRTMNLIQTDASINSGNSGGPLINAYGQVIGITSAKVASGYGEGLGFAIPIDEALPIIQDLMENGYVKGRPTLGISGSNISKIYSQFYDIPMGFMVQEVNSGSAAENAGIKKGDIIIGIEGQLIESIEEFNEIKSKYKAGDEITVSIYRNDKKYDLKVVLDEAKETDDNTQSQNQQSQRQQSIEDFYRQFGF